MKGFLIAFFIFTAFLIALLTFPMPYTLFSKSTKENFLREQPIALLQDKENKGERCKEKTVYAPEKNGYTETGEEVVDLHCAKLQVELNKAILNGNLDLVRELLVKGANVNTPNNNYDLQYPIVSAVYGRNTQIAKLLLDNGADVNHQKCCCMSCNRVLDIAIKNNDLEMVKLLLERGADVTLKPTYPDEYSTLMRVARFGNFEMAQLIEEACKNNLQCRVEFRARRFWYFVKTNFVNENT